MTSQTKYPTEIAAGMPMAKMPALLSFLEDRSRGNVNRQRAAAVRQLHGSGGGGELGELSTRGSGWPPAQLACERIPGGSEQPEKPGVP